MDPFEPSTGASRSAGSGAEEEQAERPIPGTATGGDPGTDTLCPQGCACPYTHRTRDRGREGETRCGWRSCRVLLFPSFSLQLSSHRVGQAPLSSPLPKKSLILHKSFCTGWAPSEEVDVGLLEGDTAPSGTARSLQLSQTQACTEVYKFSKAFDNVKLLGDEVGGEHTAAM